MLAATSAFSYLERKAIMPATISTQISNKLDALSDAAPDSVKANLDSSGAINITTEKGATFSIASGTYTANSAGDTLIGQGIVNANIQNTAADLIQKDDNSAYVKIASAGTEDEFNAARILLTAHLLQDTNSNINDYMNIVPVLASQKTFQPVNDNGENLIYQSTSDNVKIMNATYTPASLSLGADVAAASSTFVDGVAAGPALIQAEGAFVQGVSAGAALTNGAFADGDGANTATLTFAGVDLTAAEYNLALGNFNSFRFANGDTDHPVALTVVGGNSIFTALSVGAVSTALGDVVPVSSHGLSLTAIGSATHATIGIAITGGSAATLTFAGKDLTGSAYNISANTNITTFKFADAAAVSTVQLTYSAPNSVFTVTSVGPVAKSGGGTMSSTMGLSLTATGSATIATIGAAIVGGSYAVLTIADDLTATPYNLSTGALSTFVYANALAATPVNVTVSSGNTLFTAIAIGPIAPVAGGAIPTTQGFSTSASATAALASAGRTVGRYNASTITWPTHSGMPATAAYNNFRLLNAVAERYNYTSSAGVATLTQHATDNASVPVDQTTGVAIPGGSLTISGSANAPNSEAQLNTTAVVWGAARFVRADTYVVDDLAEFKQADKPGNPSVEMPAFNWGGTLIDNWLVTSHAEATKRILKGLQLSIKFELANANFLKTLIELTSSQTFNNANTTGIVVEKVQNLYTYPPSIKNMISLAGNIANTSWLSVDGIVDYLISDLALSNSNYQIWDDAFVSNSPSVDGFILSSNEKFKAPLDSAAGKVIAAEQVLGENLLKADRATYLGTTNLTKIQAYANNGWTSFTSVAPATFYAQLASDHIPGQKLTSFSNPEDVIAFLKSSGAAITAASIKDAFNNMTPENRLLVAEDSLIKIINGELDVFDALVPFVRAEDTFNASASNNDDLAAEMIGYVPATDLNSNYSAVTAPSAVQKQVLALCRILMEKDGAYLLANQLAVQALAAVGGITQTTYKNAATEFARPSSNITFMSAFAGVIPSKDLSGTTWNVGAAFNTDYKIELVQLAVSNLMKYATMNADQEAFWAFGILKTFFSGAATITAANYTKLEVMMSRAAWVAMVKNVAPTVANYKFSAVPEFFVDLRTVANDASQTAVVRSDAMDAALVMLLDLPELDIVTSAASPPVTTYTAVTGSSLVAPRLQPAGAFNLLQQVIKHVSSVTKYSLAMLLVAFNTLAILKEANLSEIDLDGLDAKIWNDSIAMLVEELGSTVGQYGLTANTVANMPSANGAYSRMVQSIADNIADLFEHPMLDRATIISHINSLSTAGTGGGKGTPSAKFNSLIIILDVVSGSTRTLTVELLELLTVEGFPRYIAERAVFTSYVFEGRYISSERSALYFFNEA